MGDTDQVIRDCSISLFLYKDSVYNSDSAMGSITEVIMRDNRNGDTGTGYQNMNKGQFVDVNPSEIGRIIAEAEYQEAQAKSKKAYSIPLRFDKAILPTSACETVIDFTLLSTLLSIFKFICEHYKICSH